MMDNASKKTGTIEIKAPARTMESILRKAYGGKLDDYQEGGLVEGPTHEQGGVDVFQQGAQSQGPIAEVEGAGVGVAGGERIFSVEDTQIMEEASTQVIQLMEAGQRDQAEDMAMRLGFAVVDMIARQEQMAPQQDQLMNNFGTGAQGQDVTT